MNNDKTHQDMELRALIETCYDDETKILEKEKNFSIGNDKILL